jgi:hypothetical protein
MVGSMGLPGSAWFVLIPSPGYMMPSAGLASLKFRVQALACRDWRQQPGVQSSSFSLPGLETAAWSSEFKLELAGTGDSSLKAEL